MIMRRCRVTAMGPTMGWTHKVPVFVPVPDPSLPGHLRVRWQDDRLAAGGTMDLEWMRTCGCGHAEAEGTPEHGVKDAEPHANKGWLPVQVPRLNLRGSMTLLRKAAYPESRESMGAVSLSHGAFVGRAAKEEMG
jgi:hypothetical protein